MRVKNVVRVDARTHICNEIISDDIGEVLCNAWL